MKLRDVTKENFYSIFDSQAQRNKYFHKSWWLDCQS